jgi:hypothetical protein
MALNMSKPFYHCVVMIITTIIFSNLCNAQSGGPPPPRPPGPNNPPGPSNPPIMNPQSQQNPQNPGSPQQMMLRQNAMMQQQQQQQQQQLQQKQQQQQYSAGNIPGNPLGMPNLQSQGPFGGAPQSIGSALTSGGYSQPGQNSGAGLQMNNAFNSGANLPAQNAAIYQAVQFKSPSPFKTTTDKGSTSHDGKSGEKGKGLQFLSPSVFN